MKKHILLIVAFIIAVVFVAFTHFNSFIKNWTDPSYISGLLAEDFAEQFSAEGIFYPPNDLDDPLLKDRKIIINASINEQTSKEVVRKLLYLNSIDKKTPIELYISTQGGWYDSAFAIIDAFHAIEAPVHTIGIGGCYSAGAVLMASGTGKRIAYPNTLFSIHISHCENEDDRPYSQFPDRVNGFLQKLTKLPANWFPLEAGRSYYLTASEAKKFGLIDSIMGF